MFLKEISFNNFRNLKSSSLNFGKELNFIVGLNAQGKTNLLEAVYSLVKHESFRTKNLNPLVKEGEDYFFLKGVANTTATEKHLSLGYEKVSRRTKKSDILGINTIVFTPRDFERMYLDSRFRRDYYDGILVSAHPGYKKYIKDFKKVLSQRNNLLSMPGKSNWELEFWTEQFVLLSEKIIKMRKVLIAAINEEIGNIWSDIFQKEDKRIKIEYKMESDIGVLRKKLHTDRDLEFRQGITLHGPQRDDFIIKANGESIAMFSSRGEAKSAVLALKLAESKYISNLSKFNSILILDDVFSELDPERQEFFLNQTRGNQVFITTLDEGMTKIFKNNRTFFIKEGNIHEKTR